MQSRAHEDARSPALLYPELLQLAMLLHHGPKQHQELVGGPILHAKQHCELGRLRDPFRD
jgi:hypothetical protein